MFVICFSGTISVVFDALQAWEFRQDLHIESVEAKAIDYDSLLRDFREDHPQEASQFTTFSLPHAHQPWLELATFDRTAQQRIGTRYHPEVALRGWPDTFEVAAVQGVALSMMLIALLLLVPAAQMDDSSTRLFNTELSLSCWFR